MIEETRRSAYVEYAIIGSVKIKVKTTIFTAVVRMRKRIAGSMVWSDQLSVFNLRFRLERYVGFHDQEEESLRWYQ